MSTLNYGYIESSFNSKVKKNIMTSLVTNGKLRDINTVKRLINANIIRNINADTAADYVDIHTYLFLYKSMIEILEEVYPGKWDAVVTYVSLDKIQIGFIIQHDDFTITNSDQYSHEVKGMYTLLQFNSYGINDIRFESLYGYRTKYDIVEYLNNYSHSHLSIHDEDYNRFKFREFCLGNNELGDSIATISLFITDLIGKLNELYNADGSSEDCKLVFENDTFKLDNYVPLAEDAEIKASISEFKDLIRLEITGLVMSIDNFLSWESLEGVPYKYISNAGVDNLYKQLSSDDVTYYPEMRALDRSLHKHSLDKYMIIFATWIKKAMLESVPKFDMGIDKGYPIIVRGNLTDSTISEYLDAWETIAFWVKPYVKINHRGVKMFAENVSNTNDNVIREFERRVSYILSDRYFIYFRGQKVYPTFSTKEYKDFKDDVLNKADEIVHERDFNNTLLNLIIDMVNLHVIKPLYINKLLNN